MKFTDGYWRKRDGVTVLHPAQLHDTEADAASLTAFATAKRGAAARATPSTRRSSPSRRGARCPTSIRVTDQPLRSASRAAAPDFEIARRPGRPRRSVRGSELTSGGSPRASTDGDGWRLDFLADGQRLTGSGWKGMGVVDTADGEHYVHEQLALGVGEAGLRPRRAVRPAGQERPERRHLERGRRHQQRAGVQERPVLPDQPRLRRAGRPPRPGLVRGRLARWSRAPSSASPGRPCPTSSSTGPTPAEVLRKYTALTGRPALPPAWSFGLWLTTSFTTSYDEETVTELRRRHGRARPAAERLPLRLVLDARVPLVRLRVGPADLPRPAGHAQAAARPGAAHLRLDQPVHRPALGAVRRGHGERLPGPQAERRRLAVGPLAGRHGAGRLHQPGRLRVVRGQAAGAAGHGRRLLQVRLRRAHPDRRGLARRLRPGTDAQLLHPALQPDRLRRAARGTAARATRCCSPARPPSAASSSRCTGAATTRPTFESMAESLRGGLSLAVVRVRLLEPRHRRLRGHAGPGGVQALDRRSGCCRSHSRLHGNQSYRVPWLFDEESVDVLRHVHPPQAPADAVPVRRGRPGAHARACR